MGKNLNRSDKYIPHGWHKNKMLSVKPEAVSTSVLSENTEICADYIITCHQGENICLMRYPPL